MEIDQFARRNNLVTNVEQRVSVYELPHARVTWLDIRFRTMHANITRHVVILTPGPTARPMTVSKAVSLLNSNENHAGHMVYYRSACSGELVPLYEDCKVRGIS